jgi:hypothetical protein
MRFASILSCSLAAFLLSTSSAHAQQPMTDQDYKSPEELQKASPDTYVSDCPYTEQWPSTQERDILWRKRIWRTLDTRDSGNELLRTSATAQSLAGVLFRGAQAGHFKVYSNQTEHFNKELKPSEIEALITQGAEKSATGFDAARVTRFRIREEWMYIASQGKLIARLIGIAPLQEVIAEDGVTTEKPLFWVYFPHTRPYLQQQPLQHPQLRNLDQVLETRKFSSRIDQVVEMPASGIIRK